MALPGVGGERFADLGRQMAHIHAETAMLEERWLELTEQMEALQAQSR
jgi:ATP-binding cassette subfamily F protein 3